MEGTHPAYSDAFTHGARGRGNKHAIDPRTRGDQMRVWEWQKVLREQLGYPASEVDHLTKDQCIAIFEGDSQRGGQTKKLSESGKKVPIDSMDRVSLVAELRNLGAKPTAEMDDAALLELVRTKRVERDMPLAVAQKFGDVPKGDGGSSGAKPEIPASWPQMKAMAKNLGITAPPGTKKYELIKMIEAKLDGPNASSVR